jgi:hypothetical protein
MKRIPKVLYGEYRLDPLPSGGVEIFVPSRDGTRKVCKASREDGEKMIRNLQTYDGIIGREIQPCR